MAGIEEANGDGVVEKAAEQVADNLRNRVEPMAGLDMREAVKRAVSGMPEGRAKAAVSTDLEAFAERVTEKLGRAQVEAALVARARGESEGEVAARLEGEGTVRAAAAMCLQRYRENAETSASRRAKLVRRRRASGLAPALEAELVCRGEEALLRDEAISDDSLKRDEELLASLGRPRPAALADWEEPGVEGFMRRVQCARQAVSAARERGDPSRAEEIERMAAREPAPTGARRLAGDGAPQDPVSLSLHFVTMGDEEWSEAWRRLRLEAPPERPEGAPSEDLFFFG